MTVAVISSFCPTLIVIVETENYSFFTRGCLFFQALSRKTLSPRLLSSSPLLPRCCANFKQNQISDFCEEGVPPRAESFLRDLHIPCVRIRGEPPLTKRCNDTPDLQPRGNFVEEVRRRNCCRDRETIVTMIIGIYYTVYSMLEEHVIIRVNYFMHNVRNTTYNIARKIVSFNFG